MQWRYQVGGAPLKPEMTSLIIRTWTNKRRGGEEPWAKEVRALVEENEDVKSGKLGKLPEVRTFQEIIREAKKKLLKDQSIDEDWSMASLITYDLPADTIPYVIKVWRYAIANHEKFTVMQAKWVTRLYRMYENTSYLWYHSLCYADIERTGILSGKKPFTNNTDGLNYLSGWETTNLLFTLYYYDKPRYDFAPQRIKESMKNEQIIEELLHYKNTKTNALLSYSPDTYKHVQHGKEYITEINHDLSDLIRELPLFDSLGLDEGVKMVYLRLYGCLIRGSKWNDLSPKEAINLIIDLRNWVIAKSKEIKKGLLTVNQFDDGCPWPIEILSKVGYKITADKADYVSIDNPAFSELLQRII